VTAFLILATIPTVIVALLLKDQIEAAFESGQFLGFAFLFTTLALFVSEALAKRPGRVKPAESMGVLDALTIGLCQAVAIIPGVSRSGLTLSGALSRRLNRDFAARFSFLLSIPAILGALVLQVKDLAESSGLAVTGGSAGIGALPIIAGTVTAAIVGFFAIKFMLKIVREKSLRGFAVYTGILGVLVLIDQFGTHFLF
jgi:undecaprenyl-diphosphatase